jgi:GT2 family glycosyltransferase
MAPARVRAAWKALRKRYSDIMLTHKHATRTLASVRLRLFLSTSGLLELPRSAAPDVTVVIITYNQPELVYECLCSIAEALGPSAIGSEVVILDNGSKPETLRVLERVSGATIIRSDVNLHFLRGVNRAVRAARGRHILLLNSDAKLLPGTVEAALRTLESAPDIGAVGARIALPDGTLQEAGSIIWRNGGCQGYGRGRAAADGEFMFRRDVDYCSGAFLLTPRARWDELGGFDERYAPCYYEETDYCVRLWQAGYRVVYEPDALIVHYEFGSSSMAQGVEWQDANLARFRERHAAWLACQHEASAAAVIAARERFDSRPRVLVIEDRVPHVRCGGGYPRANALLRELVAAGARVTLFPTAGAREDWREVRATLDAGVEALVERCGEGLAAFLDERAGAFDAVFVCRPHNMRLFVQALEERPARAGDAAIVYDAEALYAPRYALQRALEERPLAPDEAGRDAAAELALARGADAVLSVSPAERAVFDRDGARRTWVLGHALEPRPTPSAFGARMGFVFLGALYDDGSPNAESLRWFAAEILPRLRERLDAHVRLAVVGGVEARSIRALAPDAFELLGSVGDLAPVFDRYRVMVAPTRIASGIPHKVHDAAALGVPVVTTDLIARQLGWTPGTDLLASGEAAAFAAHCAELHENEALWLRVRRSALERVAADCSPQRFGATVREIVAAVPALRVRGASDIEPAHAPTGAPADASRPS